MAGKKHGSICTTQVGRKWIDPGTLCRTRSSPSGPLGLALSLVLGASPAEDEKARRQREAEEEAASRRKDEAAMFGWDIGVIAESPFGRSPDGAKVVRTLRTLLAGGKVVYGGTIEGSRADWDGDTIRLDDNYRGKALPSIVELVHEGSHVTWRVAHAKPKDPAEAKKDDEADEALARKNQLAVYAYVREKLKLPADEELEGRLRRTGGHGAR